MIITTKYNGTCSSCSCAIPAGSRANYQKSVGVYCPTCPAPARKRSTPRRASYRPAGYYTSLRDPRGLYAPDGRMIARVACRCEDYPCCGC